MLNLLISSIFVNNIVLTKYLGIDNILKEDDNYAFEIVLLVTTLFTNMTTYFINQYLLVRYDLEYLKTFIFILVLIIFVQLIQLVARNLTKDVASYSPYIYLNSLTFGLVFLSIISSYNLVETVVFSIGSSLGLILVIYIYKNISYRLKSLKIVDAFEGMPIMLIVMGIMALIFSKYGLK